MESYGINEKSNFIEALYQLIKDYGVSDLLTMDGAPKNVVQSSKFQAIMSKHYTPKKITKPNRPNQNPEEGVIRDIRGKR